MKSALDRRVSEFPRAFGQGYLAWSSFRDDYTVWKALSARLLFASEGRFDGNDGQNSARGPIKTFTSLCELFIDQLAWSGEHKKLEYEIEQVADQAVWVSTLMLGIPNDCAVLYYVEENGSEYKTRDIDSLLKEKADEVWPLLTVRSGLVVRKLKLPKWECRPKFTTQDNGDIHEIPALTIPYPCPPQER